MADRERKPGGQPGNQNAVKHGFYAKHFNVEENTRLEGHEISSVESEIELLRIYADRIAQLIKLEPGATGENGESAPRISELDLKAINTLAIVTQSIGGLVRTQHLTRGKGGKIEEAILDAIRDLAAAGDLQ